MTKFSIPAFVENLTPDATNAKYSRAKLKMFYVGETVDHRKFTKEFSDKLISTAPYTPVVGFYSVADEDFVGHNNVQHIYGLIPADSTFEYVEDQEQGVTFAVTDIILYTGRPDEIGAVAAKIVGKQHSLELDPNSVQYKINRDEAGNFKNIEFTSGELIGLSVLGDGDTPAFSGSEFFSAEELPDFITEDNKGKYQSLFNAMFRVEPTAEEVITEIYKALDSYHINGWLCEHKADQYIVVNTDYGVYSRYLCGRDELDNLTLTFDANVRSRFLSDIEIEAIDKAQKGSVEEFGNDTTTQIDVTSGTEAGAGDNTSASVDTEEEQTSEFEENAEPAATENENEDEFEALRSNCERLEGVNAELENQLREMTETVNSLNQTLSDLGEQVKSAIASSYSNLLEQKTIDEIIAELGDSPWIELQQRLQTEFAAMQSKKQTDIIEISTIETTFDNYDETDAASVVKKYLKR